MHVIVALRGRYSHGAISVGRHSECLAASVGTTFAVFYYVLEEILEAKK